MSNLLSHLVTVLEVLGLIAVVCLNLAACLGMAFMNFVFAFDAPKSEEKAPFVLGMILLLVLASLGLQAASIWYGLHLGKLWLALILGVLTIPAYPFLLLLAAVAAGACLLPFHLAKGLVFLARWIERKLWPTRTSPQTMNDSNPQTNLPDDLVAEVEELERGSLANQQLINDTMLPAYAAASAKRNAVIPQETMVEPYLSKAPEGGLGRMTWEEIWVFQTQPKTAVRITFTEDGAGGADFAIHV